MMTKEDLLSELKMLCEKFESIYVKPYSTEEKVIEAKIDLLESLTKKVLWCY